jgi:hypothetical protein
VFAATNELDFYILLRKYSKFKYLITSTLEICPKCVKTLQETSISFPFIMEKNKLRGLSL